MNKIDEFKAFMRTIPSIREEVSKGRYTWQQLYEIYDVYGENDKFWLPYQKSAFDVSSLLEIVKNVDLNALSKSFDGIQKILELVNGLVAKEDKPRQWYDD
ncbi:MAG: spore coat protein YlbD [Bacilli bacterium]|nr:spore coat protein YlbD [Bacilli bacterium]